MSEGRNVLYKCRLQGRLFCLLLCVLAGLVSQAQSPATTTISDTVYRADGTPAAGTLLISWPTVSTASGQAVASGTKSVTLGTGGALSVALVPNAGAAPANTFYTVVYQLSDGTVKTEFWSVGTTSPTTIAAVRTTLGSGSSAAPPATKQYVDAAVASKANDSAVVHLSGAETIIGTKQFAVAPSLPTPVQSGDAVNKAYVDAAVTTSGSGQALCRYRAGGESEHHQWSCSFRSIGKWNGEQWCVSAWRFELGRLWHQQQCGFNSECAGRYGIPDR